MNRTYALLPIAALAVASQAATIPSSIYGLAMQGGIYSISTSTGLATWAADTQVIKSQGATNGLAYDGNGSFYYYEENNHKLYNASGHTYGSVATTGFSGANANASMYDGDYYFINGSGKLQYVDTADMKVKNSALSGLKNGFGDIAIKNDGTLYSSTAGGFQTANVAGGSVTTVNSKTPQLQLGLDQFGSLYGISYGGSIYSINTATGAATDLNLKVHTADNKFLNINDAASSIQAVPEPGTMAVLIGGVGMFLKRRRAAK